MQEAKKKIKVKKAEKEIRRSDYRKIIRKIIVIELEPHLAEFRCLKKCHLGPKQRNNNAE